MNGKKNLSLKQKLGIAVASVFGGLILLGGSLSCMNCVGWLTDESSSSSDSQSNSSSNHTYNSNSESSSYDIESSNTDNSFSTSQTEIPEPRETAIGKSDKEVDWFISPKATTVRNDVTGNWRYSGFSESGIDISEYALSYYNGYFESDDEIHAVINFANKTTTRISCSGDMLFVTVLEYVDGEEHNAKLMFSGDVLQDYIIYTDNGDIELIDDPTSDLSTPSSSSDITSTPDSTSSSSNPTKENHFNDYSTPEQQNTAKCVLNTSTKKYHYPSCPDVKKIKPQNYSTIESEAAARALGYTACKRCH